MNTLNLNMMKNCSKYIAAFVIIVLLFAGCGQRDTDESTKYAELWTEEKANLWYEETGWLIGSNFNSSTAINQLEMWQAETFDPETIDRELSWAADLGFNSMRVYLHDLVWKHDSEGLLSRMEQYLEIADSHGIGTMFVLFDGVWHPNPKIGIQPVPTPHVHNSGWVQSPGIDVLADTTKWGYLEEYVKGIIGHFANDNRVQIWDIYNEPDNTNDRAYGHIELENKREMAFKLLKKSFEWAREAGPSQPITSGLWYGDWSDHNTMKPMDQFMAEQSDVISFHCYEGPEVMLERINFLKRYNRPIFCTEYMARPRGSTFEAELPILKEHKVGAYNWGFVAGKSQTIYPWDSWDDAYTQEPDPWFHDIFREDGTPYDQAEVNFIKSITR
jgi:hypothetical protein